MIYGFAAAAAPSVAVELEALNKVVADLEAQLALAKKNRAGSFLPVGVTRETADRTISEATNQINQMKATMAGVLAGTYNRQAWMEWADKVHAQIRALSGFIGKWSATSVISDVIAKATQAVAGGLQAAPSMLKWVGVGLAALAAIKVLDFLPKPRRA